MADVLHFDIEEALDLFLNVFWEKGYKATTTKELAKAAGISESSLFHSFRSKRDIYVRSLKRYNDKRRVWIEKMEGNESALEGIREYWNTIGSLAADPTKTRGCMITNATIEVSSDPDFLEYLQSVYTRYDTQFKQELDRSVAQGELSEDADTTALAQFLACSLQGLRLLARVSPSEEKVNNILNVTMSTIYRYAK